jgi:prepilin-type N-terminal cleavage/methylation domain-containing protein
MIVTLPASENVRMIWTGIERREKIHHSIANVILSSFFSLPVLLPLMKKRPSKKKSWLTSLFYKKEAKGFSLLEMVMVIAVLGVISSATIPMYRKYQVNSDLNNAQALITQGISRARELAQSGKNDSAWGFSPQNGTLYQGNSYPARTTTSDELYAIPSTITVSGITDISFTKISGKPSTNGNITLTAFDGEERLINIQVSDAGIAMNTNDLLVICHDPHGVSPQTQYISDADLPSYLAMGDTSGTCPPRSSSSQSSSIASSVSSTTSSVTSSVGSSTSSRSSSSASSVAASSVAGGGAGTSSQGNTAPAITAGILLLEPTAQNALNITGNGTLTIGSSAFVQLNTSNPYGANIAANGVLSAPTMYAYGSPGKRVSGNGSFNTTTYPNIIPSADPYGSLAVPATTTPVITTASYTGNSTATLSPGTYQGGIKAAVNAAITLLPGTYYIKTGGLSISGNASITGNGVTIYTTGGGVITLSGNGRINLRELCCIRIAPIAPQSALPVTVHFQSVELSMPQKLRLLLPVTVPEIR